MYKLKKNIQTWQSPKKIFEYLKGQIISIGFKPSNADPCWFIRNNCVCVSYVDDILIFTRSDDIVDQVILGSKEAGAQLGKEEDVAGFLGVNITRYDDSTIKMTQKGLIDRILKMMNLEDLDPK